jgi:serine protease Do
VVCIRAESGKEPLQFSGFVIDASGLVLCTAHNLDGVSGVIVTLASGRMLQGRLIRADFARDIALVEPQGRFPAAVPLPEKSMALAEGKRIFSVGCPENHGSTVYSGSISGPPGLVDGQYLLQVSMKVYPGSSGSPVFDEKGNLVAMVKARFRGMNSRGFLIPADTILDFMSDLARPGGEEAQGKGHEINHDSDREKTWVMLRRAATEGTR